jgi:hypothetical protein
MSAWGPSLLSPLYLKTGPIAIRFEDRPQEGT